MLILSLLLAAYLGMGFHWFKKVYRKQLSCGPIEYIKAHPKYTLGAFLSVTGAVLAQVATGMALTEQALAFAFTVGFTLDSTVNKASEDI